jgi:hypothetical protein
MDRGFFAIFNLRKRYSQECLVSIQVVNLRNERYLFLKKRNLTLRFFAPLR